MKHRKLRIAWSVGCVVLGLLLIALWVRSCFSRDIYIARVSRQGFVGIISDSGSIDFGASRKSDYQPWTWFAEPHDPQQPAIYFPWIAVGVEVGSAWLSLPYWLLIPLTGILAIAPWISWRKRFSLRTLLIATTLFGVILGLAYYILH